MFIVNEKILRTWEFECKENEKERFINLLHYTFDKFVKDGHLSENFLQSHKQKYQQVLQSQKRLS